MGRKSTVGRASRRTPSGETQMDRQRCGLFLLCFWKFTEKDVPLRPKISTKMSEQELNKILSDAVSLPTETEIVEFKETKEGYDFGKIGR
jgi:hypothetical protein